MTVSPRLPWLRFAPPCDHEAAAGVDQRSVALEEARRLTRSVGPDNLLSGRAKRAGSDAVTVSPRFPWLRFAPPPGQQVARANRPARRSGVAVALRATGSATTAYPNPRRTTPVFIPQG